MDRYTVHNACCTGWNRLIMHLLSGLFSYSISTIDTKPFDYYTQYEIVLMELYHASVPRRLVQFCNVS